MTSAIPPAWGQGDSLDRVIQAATSKGRKVRTLSSSEVMIQCVNPAHGGEDRNPSMHATWKPSAYGGRVLMRCYACGPGSVEQEEWAAHLGLEYDDLFDDRRWSFHQKGPRTDPSRPVREKARLGPLPKRVAKDLDELLGQAADPGAEDQGEEPEECAHRWQRVETYDYVDEVGTVVHQVHRERCEACGAKNFPQRFAAGSGWVDRKPSGFSSWLYRHPDVVDAVSAGGEVWLLEGEKDVHAAEAAGLVATTNPGGATGFPEHLAGPFTGATVNVVLDRDQAGWDRGVRVHRLLTEAGAAAVRLWLPAVLEAKADFFDHLEAGHGVEDLVPVPVEAVTAHHLLPQVEAAVLQIDACGQEARAQLALAQRASRDGRRAEGTQHRKNASRWAAEAERLHDDRLQAKVAQVLNAAAKAEGEWAAEAGQSARSMGMGGAVTAGEVFRVVGRSVPTQITTAHQQLGQAQQEASAAGRVQDVQVAAGGQARTGGGPVVEGTAALDTGGSGGGDGPGWTPKVLPGGGDGGGSRRGAVHVTGPSYNVVLSTAGRLELVEIKVSTSRRGVDEDLETTFSRLLNCDVRVARKEYAETPGQLDEQLLDLEDLGDRDPGMYSHQPGDLPEQTHVVITAQAAPGEPVTEHRLTVDRFRDGTFLGDLQIPGLQFAHSRSGRDKILAAIEAVSTATEIVTSYRGIGWRQIDGEDVYVTATGGIGADGWRPLPTSMSGGLTRFDLPMPCDDPARVRRMFLQDSAGMMEHFPDRVAAVLLGTAYRAVLCPNEWSTVLTAPPGVGKTALGALTMHHLGERWDRNRPLTSLSGNGATFNALRLMLAYAKDGLAFLDDNAPTSGIEAAYRRLEEIMRLAHNGEERPRNSRTGQENLSSGRPMTSALITTELPPRAGSSGERRGLLVHLSREDVSIDRVRQMDTLQSRHGRAVLMSSYLQWVAAIGRRDALERLAGLREEFRAWLGNHPQAGASQARHQDKLIELYAGWALMLEYLTETGALTGEEAAQWRNRVAEALMTAADCADDPDLVGSTGQRVKELLRHAMSNGLAYAADIRTGTAPEQLERVCGWSPVTRTPGGGLEDSWGPPPAPQVVDWRRGDRSIHLGYVSIRPEGAELVCTRTALEATVKAAAAALTDTSGIDVGTILRALADEGILKTTVERRPSGDVTRRLLSRTIPCETTVGGRPVREKRIVLRLDDIIGGDDVDPDDQGPVPPPPGRMPDPPTAGGRPDDEDLEGPAPWDEDPDGPGRGQEQDREVDQVAVADTASPTAPEEGEMTEHTNAGGLTVTPTKGPSQPCARCKDPYAAWVFGPGVHLHLACFWSTTATSLDLLPVELGLTTVPAAPPPVQDRHAQREHHGQEQLAAEPAHEDGPEPQPPAPAPAPREPDAAARPTAPTVTAAPAGGFTASVMVVDVDGYYLPGDTGPRQLPFPIEHAGHLEQLGRQVGLGKAPMAWRKIPEAGLVIPTVALWEQLGVPAGEYPTRPSKRKSWLEEISSGLPFLTGAVDDGWVFGTGEGDPVLRGMTRLRRSDAERGQVAILLSAPDFGEHTTQDPARVVARMELVAEALGIPYRASPISTAQDLLRIVMPRKAREALTAAQAVDYDGIPPAFQPELEPSFDWTRTPSSSELSDCEVLALYDRGGSYLAGWSSLLLGIGSPEQHGRELQLDPKRAGWWLVQLPERSEGDVDPYPDLLDPHRDRAGQQVWVTTPVLTYATKELLHDGQVLQSWTWPRERSIAWLKPLYEVLRDALARLRSVGGEDATAAAYLVKQIYKQLSGHLFSADSDTLADPVKRGRPEVMNLHHPYAFQAMRGQARVAILHQILTTGRRTSTWPVVVSNNDLVGYPATGPLQEKDCWPGDPGKLGENLGAYKLARWAPLGEHAQHLTGRGWGTAGLEATEKVTGGENP